MQIQTAMRQAFINAKITPETMRTRIVKQAVTSLQNERGVRNVPDWNAHLRFGTFNQLKQRGIPASSQQAAQHTQEVAA